MINIDWDDFFIRLSFIGLAMIVSLSLCLIMYTLGEL